MNKIIATSVAALLCGAVATGMSIGSGVTNIGNSIPNAISAVADVTLPPEPITVTEQAMVDTITHKLELTVAELTFTTSVKTGTCGESSWQRWASDDCLTMIVPGKVEADLLLDSFSTEAIETTNERVTIHLPGVTVGDVSINHQNIQVVGYNQGTFVFDPDPNLQAHGLGEAREDLYLQACRSDLLQEATLRAADRTKNLLQPIFNAVDDPRTITVVLGEPTC